MTTETSPPELTALRDHLRQFAVERDWDQFHDPRNLAISLSIEASELLEVFQWKKDDRPLTPEKLQCAKEELADVLLYLIRLADKLDIDLVAAAREKIIVNGQKYPVDKSRGSPRKYKEL